ncbi:TVAZ2 protein, partial [Psilopogon haemacephalus]|nr:TVAZ2 protein [Psilopogon haemacephalus]
CSSTAAAGRAQLQQEPWIETTEGTGITLGCSHPAIRLFDFIVWYRQLPGRPPSYLVQTFKETQEMQSPAGRLSVSANRQSSSLRLYRPRRGDAGIYYCALDR